MARFTSWRIMLQAPSWSSSSSAITAPSRKCMRAASAQLEADYKDRGVAVVAIQPNDPEALTH